jgi:cysteine desulfurase / selenocysteine lyase
VVLSKIIILKEYTHMKNIKNDFPLLMQHDISYLDSASTAQKPQEVIDAVTTAYTKYAANPGRGIYELAEQATKEYEDARKAVAEFIGAEPSEIIFVRGATEGINYIAQGWARDHLKKGDQILLSQLEHHANLLPWQRIAKQTGAELLFIPLLENGMLDMDAANQLIKQNVKLVAITHESNVIGTPVDVTAITQMAHAVGARVLVDACQSVPHKKVDVKAIGCDFLAFSGHKLLGPTGIGVLYIKKELHDEVEPLCLGGGVVREVTWDSHTLADAPEKFEAGSPSLAQVIGLHAAVNYMKKNVPFDQLRAHESELTAYAISELEKMPHVKLYGPLDLLKKEGHSITFTVDGMHAHDVAAYLDTQKVAVRAGHFCAQPLAKLLGYDAAVRASFYCYTKKEDVEKLIIALKGLQ